MKQSQKTNTVEKKLSTLIYMYKLEAYNKG